MRAFATDRVGGKDVPVERAVDALARVEEGRGPGKVVVMFG